MWRCAVGYPSDCLTSCSHYVKSIVLSLWITNQISFRARNKCTAAMSVASSIMWFCEGQLEHYMVGVCHAVSPGSPVGPMLLYLVVVCADLYGYAVPFVGCDQYLKAARLPVLQLYQSFFSTDLSPSALSFTCLPSCSPHHCFCRR